MDVLGLFGTVVVASFLVFARSRRLFLLLPAKADGGIEACLLFGDGLGGFSHEDVGVGFLHLVKHFLAVLSLRKAALEQLY